MRTENLFTLSTSPPAPTARNFSGITFHRYGNRFLNRNIGCGITGKELDSETGLYYYGARYLDPRTSRWMSGDPALGEYIPQAGGDNRRLPGMGGVYNVFNLHVYAYTHNNPVKFIDPDGRNPVLDSDGNLLGTTGENEWAGVPIVMENRDDYEPGMSQEDALNKGTKLNEYGKGIRITNETWRTIRKNGGDRRLRPYVVNNSGDTVYYKPEGKIGEYKNEGKYSVGPGKHMYMPVDGVKTCKTPKGKVFKIPTHFRVRINKRGVPLSPSALFSEYGNVDAPDDTWNALRDAFE